METYVNDDPLGAYDIADNSTLRENHSTVGENNSMLRENKSHETGKVELWAGGTEDHVERNKPQNSPAWN
jgi:hypothetical protein